MDIWTRLTSWKQTGFSNNRISECKTHHRLLTIGGTSLTPNQKVNTYFKKVNTYLIWPLQKIHENTYRGLTSSYLQEIFMNVRSSSPVAKERLLKRSGPKWHSSSMKPTSKWEKPHPIGKQTHLNMPKSVPQAALALTASNWWVVLLHHAVRSWKVWPQWDQCLPGLLHKRLFCGYINQGLYIWSWHHWHALMSLWCCLILFCHKLAVEKLSMGFSLGFNGI